MSSLEWTVPGTRRWGGAQGIRKHVPLSGEEACDGPLVRIPAPAESRGLGFVRRENAGRCMKEVMGERLQDRTGHVLQAEGAV